MPQGTGTSLTELYTQSGARGDLRVDNGFGAVEIGAMELSEAESGVVQAAVLEIGIGEFEPRNEQEDRSGRTLGWLARHSFHATTPLCRMSSCSSLAMILFPCWKIVVMA
jgi:hypothetical protein